MEKIKFRLSDRTEWFVIHALDLRTFHSFKTLLNNVVPYFLFHYILNIQSMANHTTYSYEFIPLLLELIEALQKANNLCER